MYKNRLILAVVGSMILLGALIAVFSPSPQPTATLDEHTPQANSRENTADPSQAGESDRSVMLLLGALEQRVNDETKKREQLEQDIARVQRTLRKLSAQDSELSDQLGTELTQLETSANTPPPPAQLSAKDKEHEALTSVGLNQTQIDTLEKKAESQEMAQLFLRNKAIREGWYGSERYYTENRQLENQTDAYKSTLGDDKYDRFLYLSGQPNRVLVQSVLADSPAEKAGLQPNDVIYQYDNKRIFIWDELTTATTQGQQGETVPITIMRKNQRLNMYVPRGPLGIRLEADRVKP